MKSQLDAVPKAIEKLKQTAENALKQANSLERLLALYPGLREYTGRHQRVVYFSNTVNQKADQLELGHACGCCSDSPLVAWPYLESPFGRVYSDPPQFFVGEKHWISGDYPNSGWKKEMRAAQISEQNISQVAAHFKKCDIDRKSLAESSEYVDDDE